MTRRQKPHFTDRARTLRSAQTDAESLMWYALRDRRLEGLKFRRQYPIEPYIVEFACVEHHVIIETDGDYHEYVDERDRLRQEQLQSQGWKVFRFSNEEVLGDVESAMVAIARQMGLRSVAGHRVPRSPSSGLRPPSPPAAGREGARGSAPATGGEGARGQSPGG